MTLKMKLQTKNKTNIVSFDTHLHSGVECCKHLLCLKDCLHATMGVTVDTLKTLMRNDPDLDDEMEKLSLDELIPEGVEDLDDNALTSKHQEIMDCGLKWLDTALKNHTPELKDKQKVATKVMMTDPIDGHVHKSPRKTTLRREGHCCLLIGFPNMGETSISGTTRLLIQDIGAGEVVSAAFTGVAASLVNGHVLVSTFKLLVHLALSESQILDIRTATNAGMMVILIIEESSQVCAEWCNGLDLQIQRITQRDIPFGGTIVIIRGDFMQMSPMEKQHLFGSMLGHAKMRTSDWGQKTVFDRGEVHNACHVFCQFKCLHLDEFVRLEGAPQSKNGETPFAGRISGHEFLKKQFKTAFPV